MLAILAEDDSDAECLTVIIRRHYGNNKLEIKRKGYDGCGGLCSKGARDIRAWREAGVTRFVICHDADRRPEFEIREKVLSRVVRPSGSTVDCCVAVPVQEIEAWLIADESALTSVISTLRIKPQGQPESLVDPKEWLVKQSQAANGKPLYFSALNSSVAQHMRLDVVAKKCPTFKAFLECLRQAPR